MSRSNRIYSQEFLGVTLVPFATRPRKATEVICAEGYYVAKLPGKKAKVAISSDDCFKANFARNDWVQRRVARVLHQVGAIPTEVFDNFKREMKQKDTDKARKEARRQVDELEYLARDLGIELTDEQNAKLTAMLNIEAA